MAGTLLDRARTLYERFAGLLGYLQSPLLLAMRLFWGSQFFLTGKGKLMNLERTTTFFASLNIPMPGVNAAIAGTTEMVGGALLVLGLGSRLASIPLVFTMLVAYATAEREALSALLTDPSQFTGAEPFLFMLTALVVLAFGPGAISLDELLKRRLGLTEEAPAAA
ncbi:MAG TPA: DoxX family protein [Blastocatellia bacterium]|nr:DoxX family protein [Blastocatellia bacterium]